MNTNTITTFFMITKMVITIPLHNYYIIFTTPSDKTEKAPEAMHAEHEQKNFKHSFFSLKSQKRFPRNVYKQIYLLATVFLLIFFFII